MNKSINSCALKAVIIMLIALLPTSLFGQEVKQNVVRLDSVPAESQLHEHRLPAIGTNVSPVADFKPDVSVEKAPAIDPKATEVSLPNNPNFISWSGGGLYGYHGSMASLTSFRNIAGANVVQQWGNMSLMSGMNISQGIANGIGVVNGWGGDLALGYALSDNVSVTAIGGMNSYGMLSPAPNISTAYYGGYFTLKTNNGKWGLDLGVRRVLNPMTGRWETVPIAMPYFNLYGQKLGIDVGGLFYSLFRSAAESVNKPNDIDMKNGRGPAIIMPPVDTKITFGTPEIPKWMEKQFENQ